MNYAIGVVLWVEARCDDGSGSKNRPAIVVDQDEDGTMRVLLGTSQKATRGALITGEFLVDAQSDMSTMGLTKATRFSWKRDCVVRVNPAQVSGVLGSTPNAVIGLAVRAGRAAGVL